MFNHCRVSEREHVRAFVWEHVRRESEIVFVWVCERERERVCVCMCVRHGTRLRCKNDQNEPAPLFGDFLSLPFVSATTLIHSDVLLFITKWLLTKLLYALQRAHTNLFTTPLYQSWRVNSLAIQVIHKVGFIEFCYIFLTFILLRRNTLVSEWKLLVFWCF